MHWNGSIVSNNFIDYYRTIYEPTHNASFSCQLPLSSHNQYQVFRYLYMKRKEVQISNLSFTSVGDVINWTDVNKLQKLADYEPLTVTLGNNQGEKELPPAVCTQVAQTDTVTFDNLYLQANNCCPLVLYKSITLYDNFLLKFHCSKFNVNFNDVYPFTNCIYSNGIYKSNEIDIEGLVIKQDELPKSFNGWGNYLAGTKIVKDNIEWIYKYIINGSSAEYQWVDNRLNMDSSISSNYDAVTINSDNFTYALNNLDGVRFYTTSDKNITLTIDENYRYKTFVIYNYSNYNITFRAYHNSASITDFTLKPHNSCIVRWKFNAAKIEVINTDNLKYVYSTQPTAINPNEILVIIDLGIICYTNASGDIIASNNMSVCRRYGTTAQRPTTDILGKALIIGTQYFDSTLNKPIWWDGSKWVDATGIDV